MAAVDVTAAAAIAEDADATAGACVMGAAGRWAVEGCWGGGVGVGVRPVNPAAPFLPVQACSSREDTHGVRAHT